LIERETDRERERERFERNVKRKFRFLEIYDREREREMFIKMISNISYTVIQFIINTQHSSFFIMWERERENVKKILFVHKNQNTGTGSRILSCKTVSDEICRGVFG
tara:strand:- start:579 stop:899 length:321 start_codon:yes stop_codon:yes gene_type:complete